LGKKEKKIEQSVSGAKQSNSSDARTNAALRKERPMKQKVRTDRMNMTKLQRQHNMPQDVRFANNEVAEGRERGWRNVKRKK